MAGSTLTRNRRLIADALTGAGLAAHPYTPDRIVPPVALVTPADPYLTTDREGVPFGQHAASWWVLLIGDKGTNTASAEAMDDQIAAAVAALETATYDVDTAAGVTTLNIAGAEYLGCLLTVTTTDTIDP